MRWIGVAAVGSIAAAVALAATRDEPPGDERPFEAIGSFVSPEACIRELASVVAVGAGVGFDRSVGPYAIAPGDLRAHRVRAEGGGHEIEEWRCLGAAMSRRRWTHAMSEVKPFTIEDIEKMSFPAS